MARVAVVTGGTRGIGAAISKALHAADYKVAAVYAGNDEAAAKFKADTGIGVYKWNIASFDACSDGLKQVAADLGPVEVLVNNAGITRDAMFHKMKPEQWLDVINTNLVSLFNMCRPVIEGMRERKFSWIYQYRDGAGRAQGGAGEGGPAADSREPPRRARRDRPLRPVPGRR
jgi:acetoacetyl-CoA reductase